jgi:hypothetical protein
MTDQSRIIPFLNSYASVVSDRDVYKFAYTSIFTLMNQRIPLENEKIRFPGSMPFSLSRKQLQLIDPSDWVISVKTDGTRVFLLLIKYMACLKNKNGEMVNQQVCAAFLANRSMKILMIPGVCQRTIVFEKDSILEHAEDPSSLFNGTLFDGDLVQDKNDGKKWYFVPQDVYATCGNIHDKRSPQSKHQLLEEIHRQDILQFTNYAPFQFFFKSWSPLYCLSKFISNMDKSVPFAFDGIIFQNKNKELAFKQKEIHTLELVYLWKLVENCGFKDFQQFFDFHQKHKTNNILQVIQSIEINLLEGDVNGLVIHQTQNLFNTFGMGLREIETYSFKQIESLGNISKNNNASEFIWNQHQFLQNGQDAVKIPFEIAKQKSSADFAQISLESIVKFFILTNGNNCESFIDNHEKLIYFHSVRNDKQTPNFKSVVQDIEQISSENISKSELKNLFGS